MQHLTAQRICAESSLYNVNLIPVTSRRPSRRRCWVPANPSPTGLRRPPVAARPNLRAAPRGAAAEEAAAPPTQEPGRGAQIWVTSKYLFIDTRGASHVALLGQRVRMLAFLILPRQPGTKPAARVDLVQPFCWASYGGTGLSLRARLLPSAVQPHWQYQGANTNLKGRFRVGIQFLLPGAGWATKVFLRS